MTATSPSTATAGASGATGAASTHFDRAIVAVTAIPFVGYLALHLLGVPALVGAALLILGGPHVLSTLGLYLEPGVARLAGTNPLRFVWLPCNTPAGLESGNRNRHGPDRMEALRQFGCKFRQEGIVP